MIRKTATQSSSLVFPSLGCVSERKPAERPAVAEGICVSYNPGLACDPSALLTLCLLRRVKTPSLHTSFGVSKIEDTSANGVELQVKCLAQLPFLRTKEALRGQLAYVPLGFRSREEGDRLCRLQISHGQGNRGSFSCCRSQPPSINAAEVSGHPALSCSAFEGRKLGWKD